MNFKKKKIFVIIISVLLHCTLFQTSFANPFETVEEILRFCNDNGHRYIAILDQHTKAYHSSMKSSMNNIRIKSFANKDNLTKRLDAMDTLIIKKDMSTLQFEDILEMMRTRKRQKSILVLNEIQVEDFKVSIISFVHSI